MCRILSSALPPPSWATLLFLVKGFSIAVCDNMLIVLVGADLRRKGLNRIGNLLIPNDNYVKFEEFVMPVLDTMLKEQKETANSKEPVVWSPSKMIRKLGQEIKDERSVYYWCAKNDIPGMKVHTHNTTG